MTANTFNTQGDFITHEIKVWGFEYIENLLNHGYDAILTTAGWKWVLPNKVANDESLHLVTTRR